MVVDRARHVTTSVLPPHMTILTKLTSSPAHQLTSTTPTTWWSDSFTDAKLSDPTLQHSDGERDFPACCLVRVFCHFYSMFFSKLVKMTRREQRIWKCAGLSSAGSLTTIDLLSRNIKLQGWVSTSPHSQAGRLKAVYCGGRALTRSGPVSQWYIILWWSYSHGRSGHASKMRYNQYLYCHSIINNPSCSLEENCNKKNRISKSELCSSLHLS